MYRRTYIVEEIGQNDAGHTAVLRHPGGGEFTNEFGDVRLSHLKSQPFAVGQAVEVECRPSSAPAAGKSAHSK